MGGRTGRRQRGAACGATAMDALDSGSRPQVVREACADRSPALHENDLADLDAEHADVVDLAGALACLQRPA